MASPGSVEQGNMEETGCKVVCGALTTPQVRGLMMMMMMMMISGDGGGKGEGGSK